MAIDWNKIRNNLSNGQNINQSSNINWDNVRNRLGIKPITNTPVEAPSPVVKPTTAFNVPFKKLVEQPMSTIKTPTPSATQYLKQTDTTQSIRKQIPVVSKEPTKIDKFNSFAEANFPKSDTRFKKAIDLWSPKAQLLTAKDFASDMLSAADLAIRSIRSSTILASTPVAWMFDKMTGGNLSWNDIYSVTKDAAGRQIKKQDDFDKPMKDAAQLYLKNKGVKSLKDVGVDDIIILASLGLSNLMGDPLMYLPITITKVAKGLKDVATYKKVGQTVKELAPGIKNVKPVKPFDIPITPKGELKIKVIPGEQKVVIKGYVKRGYKPPTQPGAIGITEGQTVDPIVSQIEKYAGTKVNAIVDGSDLVITPTIKVTEQALAPTIEATTKEIESLTSESTVKPQEAITEALPTKTTVEPPKPKEAKIEPIKVEDEIVSTAKTPSPIDWNKVRKEKGIKPLEIKKNETKIQQVYYPAKKLNSKFVYSKEKFIIGEYNGKPYTSDSYILEFNDSAQPPVKAEVFTGEGKVPTSDAIESIIPKGELQKITVNKVYNYPEEKTGEVLLSNNSIVNKKYIDYFLGKYNNAELYSSDDRRKPIVIKQNNELVGLIMPIYKEPSELKSNNIIFDSTKKTTDKISGSKYASVGGYKDGTVIEFGGLENIKPIEIPEMIRLARELTGTAPGTKNFAKSRGMFYAQGNGTIKLDRNLFKRGQEEQLAKTLAHEIGHLIDYLPEKTMKRGNLLGSLQSLHKFTKNTFGDDVVTNAEIRKELKELSKYWRPWDEATASKSFKSYRNSARELYADAISMMLNSPGTVERMAPKFYEAWFKNLDKKPEVATNYLKLQELMSGTREEILHARYEDIKRGFESGKIKAEQLQKEVEARNKMKTASIYERTRMEIDDINYHILKKIKKLEASGTIIPEDVNPKYLLQEMTMTDTESHTMMNNLQVEVINPLAEAGVSWDDFGIYQFLNRVINERKDIANPYGFNTKNAPEQMEYLKNLVGEEKFKLIEDSNIKYHDIIFPVIERGVSVGTINQEKFNEIILPNKYNYGTFQVIDYMQDYIPATLKGQVGTLKEISNPATATLLKTISLLRLNALNEAKGSVKNLFPLDFEKSKTITSDGKLHISVIGRGKGEFKIMENGKVVSYDTDPYIAEAFKSYKTGDLRSVVKIIETLNNTTFKPLYTSYNLGFILGFNPIRDFKRSYKLIKGATVRKLLFAYIDSFGSAWKYAGGELDEFTKSMVENKAIDAPIDDYEFDPATNDDIYRILKKYHLIKEDSANSWYNRNKATKIAAQGLISLLEGMRYLGNTFEIISKIAGAKVRMAGGETGKTLSYNIRNYTGTPNWRVRGSATKTTNAIFIFSNIMKEGIKTDLQIATNPKTRAGYWWKTAKVDLMPKILMFLAEAGVFGAAIQKIMNDQSEYDKTNYTLIPLGEYNGKGVVFKIPSDESGRLISAIMWKMMNFSKNQELKNLTDIFSFGAGQLPSVTPVLKIPFTWKQYLSGRNPYDSWGGKLLIDEDTWNVGGGAALSKMVQWTLNQTGLTEFSTYDPSFNNTFENIIKVVPIVNRFIKISNYGQTEELKKIQQQGVQEDSKIRLKKKELLNNYLREYKNGKMTADDVIYKTTWEIYGQNATKQNLNSVQEMATNMYLRKQNDPYISAITYATDNQDKIRIIEMAYEELLFEDFQKFIETSYNFKLISADIANQAAQRFSEKSK